ncbi:MAG: GcrA family cell cycle regulator, partial [Bradyrhizobium sp.]|nr:GcrA family cell cycle regulator [Bradyrhizobium sp.]
MQSTDWPDQHSMVLRDLHAKGLSYAEIARALNAQFGTTYTRNATLGRGKRMGLAPVVRQ